MGIGGAAFLLVALLVLAAISLVIGVVVVIVARTAPARSEWLVPSWIYLVGGVLLSCLAIGTIVVFIIPPIGLIFAIGQFWILGWLSILTLTSSAVRPIDTEQSYWGWGRRILSLVGLLVIALCTLPFVKQQQPLTASIIGLIVFGVPIWIYLGVLVIGAKERRRRVLAALAVCAVLLVAAVSASMASEYFSRPPIQLDLTQQPSVKDGGNRFRTLAEEANKGDADRASGVRVEFELPNGKKVSGRVKDFMVRVDDGEVESISWREPLTSGEDETLELKALLRDYKLSSAKLAQWRACVGRAQMDIAEGDAPSDWEIEYRSATRFTDSDLLLLAHYIGPPDTGDSPVVTFTAYWGSGSRIASQGYSYTYPIADCRRYE